MPRSFGQHPRLARARGRDDPGDAADVGDGRQLVGGQRGVAVVRRRSVEPAVLELDGMHDVDTVDRRAVSNGAAVDPDRTTVRCDDVAEPVTVDDLGARGARPVDRLPSTRPAGPARADVDRVRVDEVAELVDLEGVTDPERVRFSLARLVVHVVEIDGERDDDTTAPVRGVSEALDGRGRRLQRRDVDLDAIAAVPVARRRLVGVDDDVPTELGRTTPDRDVARWSAQAYFEVARDSSGRGGLASTNGFCGGGWRAARCGRARRLASGSFDQRPVRSRSARRP